LGLLDDLLGNSSADAAKAAAADTYKKQQAAVQNLLGYGDQYATGMADLAKGYQPWQATGQMANDAVQRLISDPSSVQSLPGYQFDLSQGTRALDQSALSNGNLFSGKTGKALQGYGINLADKTYGNQLSRLLGVSNQGLGATQAAIGTEGQGLTGQLGARTTAYGGDMNSAGTIGQGDIAAANAKMKGLQGLLNFGGQLAGSALSFGSGGSSFGGGGLSSLFGGGGGSGISGYDSYGGTTFPKVGSGWG
jgi:hypothetical protein